MKKLIKLFLCIALMLVSVYLIHYYYTEIEPKNNKEIVDSKDKMESISDLREKYDNNEIVMSFEIPDLITLPIVQTENNDYYLSHDLHKKENNVGTPFLDYRIRSLNDKKVIIYGYNDVDSTLPFSALTSYKDESFYKTHPVILVNSNEGKRRYEIFSCFVDDKNFNYDVLNVFNNTKYEEQLKLLKDKSDYDTAVSVNRDDRILILLTGTLNESKDSLKYQFVVAKENNSVVNK